MSVACVSPLLAADLPSRRAPAVYAPPIPPFSWEGFYAGAQVGYAFGRDSVVANLPPFGVIAVFPGATFTQGYSPNGVIGGGHAGYNFSSKGFFGSLLGPTGVIGIEGDIDASGYGKSINGIPFGFSPADTASIRSEVQGSIRGRFGFGFDRALIYATGGAAFADFKTSYNILGGFDQFTHSRLGYTVGGGVEYAFTNNIALRAEYRYSDYGTFTDGLVNASAIPGTTVRHRETIQRVQVGISYLFSSPAAVVARY